MPTGDTGVAGARDPGAYVYPVPPQGTDGNQTDNLLSALNLQTDAATRSRSAGSGSTSSRPARRSTGAASRSTDFGQRPDVRRRGRHRRARRQGSATCWSRATSSCCSPTPGPRELSDFAAQVYRNVITPGGTVVTPQDGRRPRRRCRARRPDAADDPHWPRGGAGAGPDRRAVRAADRRGRGRRRSSSCAGAGPDSDASGADVPAGEKDPVVEAGRGAYVLSGGWSDTDQGSPFVIDSKGRANPLVGDDAAGLLGYGGYDVAVVPGHLGQALRLRGQPLPRRRALAAARAGRRTHAREVGARSRRWPSGAAAAGLVVAAAPAYAVDNVCRERRRDDAGRRHRSAERAVRPARDRGARRTRSHRFAPTAERRCGSRCVELGRAAAATARSRSRGAST